MTAPDDGWIELYHPGLEATTRSTVEAYEVVWSAKGWVPLADVAGKAANKIVNDLGHASNEELRTVARLTGGDAEGDREALLAHAKIVQQHAGAETPIGATLAGLGVTVDTEPAPKPVAKKNADKEGN